MAAWRSKAAQPAPARHRHQHQPAPAPPGPRPTGEGRRLHGGLGRPRLERVQRGQAVLDRLPGDGAGGDRGAPARVRGRRRVRGRPVAVLVPAARQGAAVAGRRGVGAPARALARPATSCSWRWRATSSSPSSSGARLYYHLRTGAPWTNFARFWRLVVTNSDPTSGNALEQVPKWVMALSAGMLLAEEPTAGSVAQDRRRGPARRRPSERWPGAGSSASACPPIRRAATRGPRASRSPAACT